MRTPQPLTIALGDMKLNLKLNKMTIAQIRFIDLSISRITDLFEFSLLITPLIGEKDVTDLKALMDRMGSGDFVGVTAGVHNLTITDTNHKSVPWLDILLGDIDVLFIIVLFYLLFSLTWIWNRFRNNFLVYRIQVDLQRDLGVKEDIHCLVYNLF